MFPGVPGDVFGCSKWIATAGTAANGLYRASWTTGKIKKKTEAFCGTGLPNGWYPFCWFRST